MLDCIQKITDFRGRTPKKLGMDWSERGYLALSALNVKDGYIDFSQDVHYGDQSLYEKWMTGNELHKGQVLFTTEAPMGNVAQVPDNRPYILSQRTIAFEVNIDLITEDFLATILRTPSVITTLTALSSGGTAKGVSQKTLATVKITIPANLYEQEKLSYMFSEINHLITLHQRKCDETKKLKKFMLQKMFPKNGEKNPEIRFAGFTDDWEQRKLGEICERLTRKNKDNESDLPLTISSQHGLIDQRDFFNKVVAAKDMSEYYLLQKGEFAYNKSYSNGYDYGSIKRLNSYEKGCLSTLYICFKLISDKVNSDYLECYFDTLAWYHDVSQICSEGARNHGLLNVDVKAFFTEVTVKLPVDVKEQQQISAILHSLDHLITLHQRK